MLSLDGPCESAVCGEDVVRMWRGWGEGAVKMRIVRELSGCVADRCEDEVNTLCGPFDDII
jgi:hypothetical protein